MDQQKNIFTTKEHFIKQHRLLVIATSLVVVLSVVLIVAPIVMKQQFAKQLRQLGASKVEIENVDFNLFTGELVIDNTQYAFPQYAPFNCHQATVNIDIIPLFSSHFFINNFQLDNCTVLINHLDDKTWLINGLKIPAMDGGSSTSAKTAVDWLVGIHRVSLSNVVIEYQDRDLNAKFDAKDIAINDFFPWEPDVLSTFSVNMVINGAPLTFAGSAKPFHGNRSLTASLSISELALEKFSPLINTSAFALSQGTITTELELQSVLNEDNQYEVKISGFVDNRAMSAVMSDSTLAFDKLLWNGKADLAIDRLDLSTSLFTDYTVALDNLNFDAGNQPWNMNVATITAQGQVSAKAKNKGIGNPHVITNFNANNLSLRSTNSDLEIARIGSIGTKDFEWLSKDQIRIPGLNVGNARLIGRIKDDDEQRTKQPYLVKFSDLSVDTTELRDMHKLTTASVTISDMQTQLVKLNTGNLLYIDQVKQTFQPVTTAKSSPPDSNTLPGPAEHATPEDKFYFQVGIFETKGKNSFTFKDFSVQPDFLFDMNNLSIKMVSIDNSVPDNKTQINLNSDLGKSGKFSLDGTSQLFSPQLTTELNAKIQRLELHPLSGYTLPVSGRKIRHGFLNSTSKISIANRKLDNDNKLVFQNLALIKDDQKTAKKYDQQMPLPLEMAIDFLKDNKGRIELSVPVNGSLDNPEFRFMPAVAKAIRETMQYAALSYIKYTLQPWGTLISVGELVAGQISKVAFEPMLFPAGSSNITSNQKTYLDKIAKLMQETPHLGLTICGIATAQDKNALTKAGTQQTTTPPDQQELINLAQQRASAVRDYFENQKSIKRKRLHDCNATYHEQAAAKPSVEFIF